MEHSDIVKLVQSMQVRPLIEETFEEFVQGCNGLFELKGQKFQVYGSPGDNENSSTKHDFSKCKPEYTKSTLLTFDNLDVKAVPGMNKKWIKFQFEEDVFYWGLQSGREPLKFGFDAGKALYIAEQDNIGTIKSPWETIYFRI